MTTQHLHTYCAMCASRCGVLATVEDGRLTKVTADPEHPNGCICVKGAAAPEIVYAPDRLQYPMVRTRPKGDPDPGWARLSWDEALDLTASRLLEIKARYGPEAVVFPVATPIGTASQDFLFWAWRLANAFGSPNAVANTHICQWHRDTGARYTYGVSTPPPDYEHARCMLLWGFNPQATWPAAAMRISRARARGAKLIVIDPRKTGLAALEWLRELAARYTPERSEAMTWVPAGEVRRAVRLFATETPSCYYTWAGLEQRVDATQTTRAVSLFYALTGQFDSRGSNVLFASTPVNPVMGLELLPRGQASRRLGYAERPLGPSGAPGLVRPHDVYRAILTGRPYPVKALVAFGTDPLIAHADPLAGKRAMEALDFSVHVDLFANPTASLADLLLPAASCWEGEAVLPSPPPYALAEHTATWAQARQAVVRPVHEARPDLEIIFALAQRLGLGEHFFGGDLETAFNHYLAPSGLTVQQLREHPAGIRVPGETRYRKYAAIDAQTGQPRGFQTPTRKLEIYATSFARAGYSPLPVVWEPAETSSRLEADETYPLVLTCFRLVQFCDDHHRNIPRVRRQVREPFLEIHPSTAAPLRIQDGEWVVLETAVGRVRLKARFNAALHPRVVATQYGWWQACRELGLPGYDPFGPEGANVNLLIPNDVIDPISGSVPHRAQRCRVRKAEGSV